MDLCAGANVNRRAHGNLSRPAQDRQQGTHGRMFYRWPESRLPEMHEARSVSRPGLEISKRDGELVASPFYLIAATTTTVSAATAGSRSGFRSRAGFVNSNCAAIQLGPVKGFDGGARLVRVSDLNKTKTTGSTRVTVLDDGRPGDLSESCKGLVQPCVSGVIREVTYVYVHISANSFLAATTGRLSSCHTLVWGIGQPISNYLV